MRPLKPREKEDSFEDIANRVQRPQMMAGSESDATTEPYDSINSDDN